MNGDLVEPAEAPRSRARTAAHMAAHVAGLVLAAFYLGQHSRTGTNHTDGGLILTYIDDMARGLRPHWDFIDAYGTLNWPLPVLFYKLAGDREWGVRIWMLVLKLVIVAMSYLFVRRLAGTLFAVLTAVWMSLLYGQAWQSLQTAYGFNNVIPFVLGTWHMLLIRPFKRLSLNLVVAGLLTGVAVWIKVNSGLFVLAGGVFYCIYWLPAPPGTEPAPNEQRFQAPFRSVRTIGLIVMALVFFRYISKHFHPWYFVYLYGPLLIGLFYTAHRLRVSSAAVPVRHHVRAAVAYFGAFGACALVVLLAITHVTDVFRYLREQSDILVPLRYSLPFPALGIPDKYVGFNENFWPQLPWVPPLLFLAWIALGYGERSKKAFGERWPEIEGLGVGLYVMGSCYLFNLYSRADETHIFQAMVVVPPVVLVLIRQIEAMCTLDAERTSLTLRSALAVTLLAWGSTLAVRPGFVAFDLSNSERKHPKLQYLRYRELDNPYVRDFTADITDHEWDRQVDLAAAYVDSITDDGATILVLDADRLFHILSNTRPVGGRYHFYFYLIATKLFDREGYDRSVPPSVLQEILDNPPKVVIGADERMPPVAAAFPELRRMVNEHYRITHRFRHILIYERTDTAVASHAP